MDEHDGIQTGKDIRNHYTETFIIYVTIISEKMSEALNTVHSFGYLVKPIIKKDLFQIMTDGQIYLEPENVKEKILELLEMDNGLELVEEYINKIKSTYPDYDSFLELLAQAESREKLKSITNYGEYINVSD